MNIMTTALAEKLNGRECGDEVTIEEAKRTADCGLVVVYGASDDLMEFRGAIEDEVGCYNGGVAYLTKDGLLENECENENCPHFARMKQECPTIAAVWDHDGYSWTYSTDIPHATFDILEDGEKYCRGIVFSMEDL